MKKFILIFMLCMSIYAAAIGKVKKAVGSVSVQRESLTKVLKTGDFIYKSDYISTGKKSFVAIYFNDNTQFRLGSNSDLKVENYLFNKSKNSKMAFSSNRGSLDVITGYISKIARKNFKLRSGTVVIGIRGTRFNIDASELAFGCQNGAISVDNGMKTLVVGANQMVLNKPDGFSKILPFESKKFGILRENWLNNDKFDYSRHEERRAQREAELKRAKERKALREKLEKQYE